MVEAGCKVLLLDLDAQANLSLALGQEPGKALHSSANLLLGTQTIFNTIQKLPIENLEVIPSSSEIGLAERHLPIQLNYENRLRDLLHKSSLHYDFVLMDCPPFLGAVTLSALVASDLLLIPTQAEYFSIYALRNLMDLVRKVRRQFNPQLTYRLLLTMVDRRNRTHRVLAEQLRESFPNGLLDTVIEIDTKLRESPIAGVPILNHAPRSRAATQYRALAQEIMIYAKTTPVQSA